MTNPERQGRRSTVGGLTRRRQRSSSEQDELSTSTPEGGGYRRRRSTKRRRLNAGVDAPTRKAIKYGYYGQVEPGRLKLALVSCDGGEHVDARHPETSLGPENLLRHDKSVYCSERPQSNIVLKHADDTPFCLEKLHIVGPEIGFTAPVRAGVVYVAMTMAELQKYLDPPDNDVPPNARRSRYSPYHRQRQGEVRSGQSSPELLSIAEALRDPYINAAHGSRDNDAAHDSDADIDAYCDSNPTTDPNTWLHDTATNTFVRRTQPVTILSDEDAGPEESSPQEVLDYRFQRERMMRRRYDIENWHLGREAGVERGYSVETGHQLREREREREAIANLPLSRLLARQRDREQDRTQGSPSSSDDSDNLPALEPITPPPQPGSEEATGDSAVYCQLTGLPLPNSAPVRATDHASSSRPTNSSNLNAEPPPNPTTIAPFRLGRGKFKCAIAFDPPVSGRFVLLKLWAAKRGRGDEGWEREREGNVDVQAIVAKGWMGGMRFFPAVERM